MKCYVGIDLGSTTSKAVILDDAGEILGRGITNSRSNYEMASSVARTEAYVNAKFTLFGRALAALGDTGGFTEALERSFRLEQYLAQLRLLERFTVDEAEGPRYASVRDAAKPRLEAIHQGMRDEAPSFFAAGARRKSDFFRDIAGGSYQTHAEKVSDPQVASFSMLLSLYDKAILRVENEPPAAVSCAARRRSRRSARRWTRSAPSARATAARGCRSRRTASAARSCATGSVRTRWSPPRAPCSTSAGRTPRRSRWTATASSRASR